MIERRMGRENVSFGRERTKNKFPTMRIRNVFNLSKDSNRIKTFTEFRGRKN